MAPLPQPPQPRRKGAGIRTWLVVSDSGKSHLEEVGKHPIMRRTGLPARDLRILDPVLSYPSTILGRERAIVVNLEHIKAIITATEVLVLNFKDPAVAPFVRDLEYKVSNCTWAIPPHATEGSDHDMEVPNKAATGEFPKLSVSNEVASQKLGNSLSENPNDDDDVMVKMGDSSPKDMLDVPKTGGPKVLPFEFKALEVCLECACRCLETETSTLEQEAYPALDELTSKISTLNLQRARHIKSRLVALFGRVQKVRDELENLLDDDMDMAEMYLTDKLVHLRSEEIASKEEINNGAFESDGESDDDLKSNESSGGNITGFKPNVEELEMLLEAYFAQIEGTLNKLSTMREYVDDTEDYINIMLDDKQNQLLQMGVLLSTATLLLNAGIVVVGIFGMNIHIDLFDPPPGEDPDHPSSTKFWRTTYGTFCGCLVLYFIAIYCGKKRGLLE
ncbi:Magnesium transporter MRS2/LPE10 [Macleaya cordata]|uniref:Magnesium transporter n=1 Tax=Macleaya cordata TaxID=56857 RepID=A0A200Q2V5_MACCD|nr:Magnesium transporter MRS2/LPE10 [Macleaya cordata]